VIVDGPGARPLSEGQNTGQMGGASLTRLTNQRRGNSGNGGGLRMAMSETDSVEDLTYSPYGVRRGVAGYPIDTYGLSSRALQQHDDEMSHTGGKNQSESPSGTLNRQESTNAQTNGGEDCH